MIEAESLSKVYGTATALSNVSFRVEPGEILGFLGPNGAGKTTTMRILAGYLSASSGTAQVAGFDVHKQSMAVRQSIGYLPEQPPLYPDMTVQDFLDFVARIKRVAARERTTKVQQALERCNLTGVRRTLIRKLSKGFKQRVGIAQALVHDPPVIILDEPTVGLDPKQISDVRNLIKSLAGSHTIILSTHILPEVSATCNRVAIINQGRIVATDTPEGLTARLSSGERLELEVSGDAEAVASCLQQVPELRSWHSEPQRNGHLVLTITGEAGQELSPRVAATLIQHGFSLYELRRSQESLEDVFLKLTTQDVSETKESEASEQPIAVED
ncbi:ABC transporter ATP-binding protein [Leptolyngbya sp. FACHB-261]|uniref:ABC transporter ATP-binding protein n=1 Tax=Leptolyngbya sp. FACHB-261 TaxID=2692806 RepID=UPI001685E4F3|nr:ABC transporter ATP-binding protein [Leptolyngbya sp. FACHB-261]MBD2101436.1 ABC transporter ATP-binding protein [Leptolyngbya sp. FACHB-261]